MNLVGPFHCLAGGFVFVQIRASSLAVATDEFRVQQKTMIGFWQECVAIISGSLEISIRYNKFCDEDK